MDLKVDVPHVRVALPESSKTKPVALGPMDGVRIGAHRGRSDSFELVPLDPSIPKAAGASSLTRIESALRDVQVTKGADLDVHLDGNIVVAAGNDTEVSGQIHLKNGGRITVQGKKFVVENGVITFVGPDASNPDVHVKARWTAQDGTRVYATFAGPLKTGKVTLTSDPALPRDEIVQLLLYGTPDGAQPQSPSGSTSESAIGTVGGEAAQPLNHMLNQWGLGAVSVKVDTSQGATPKPEVEIQVARDISLQLAVVVGQPPPGVNPDRTLLTVDWRFVSRWSLASTVGDAGTTIFDVLWRKRY
jgi:translocation and assembly module TamB